MKLQLIIAVVTILFVFQVHGKELKEEWNYRNQGNDWMLDSCYKSNNNQQSPINLVSDANVNVTVLGDVSVAPGMTNFTQSNNGHTIVLNYKAPKVGDYFLRAKLQDSTGETHLYDAIQFHFHAASEHAIEGHHSPLEMHIVCARTDGTTEGRYLAVLGLMFETDATSDQVHLVGTVNSHISMTSELDSADKDTLGNVYERILSEAGEEKRVEVDMQDFFHHIPFMNELYHYEGSLTTPGCAELVHWYVNKNVVRISENQLMFFRQLWVHQDYNNAAEFQGFGNNRALQDLGTRKIYGGKYEVILETTESYKAVQDDTNLVHRNIYMVLSIVLMIFVFFYGIFTCCKCYSMTTSKKTKGQAYRQEDSPSKKVVRQKSPGKAFTQGNTDE